MLFTCVVEGGLCFFCFFTLVTGAKRSLGLQLSYVVHLRCGGGVKPEDRVFQEG